MKRLSTVIVNLQVGAKTITINHDAAGKPRGLNKLSKTELLRYMELYTTVTKEDIIFMINDSDRSREHKRILNSMKDVA